MGEFEKRRQTGGLLPGEQTNKQTNSPARKDEDSESDLVCRSKGRLVPSGSSGRTRRQGNL